MHTPSFCVRRNIKQRQIASSNECRIFPAPKQLSGGGASKILGVGGRKRGLGRGCAPTAGARGSTPDKLWCVLGKMCSSTLDRNTKAVNYDSSLAYNEIRTCLGLLGGQRYMYSLETNLQHWGSGDP